MNGHPTTIRMTTENPCNDDRIFCIPFQIRFSSFLPSHVVVVVVMMLHDNKKIRQINIEDLLVNVTQNFLFLFSLLYFPPLSLTSILTIHTWLLSFIFLPTVFCFPHTRLLLSCLTLTSAIFPHWSSRWISAKYTGTEIRGEKRNLIKDLLFLWE